MELNLAYPFFSLFISPKNTSRKYDKNALGKKLQAVKGNGLKIPEPP